MKVMFSQVYVCLQSGVSLVPCLFLGATRSLPGAGYVWGGEYVQGVYPGSGYPQDMGPR